MTQRSYVHRTVALVVAAVFGMVALAAIPVATEARADDTSQQTAAIAALIKKTWEKPDQLITVEPVVFAGAHAVASWVQGARGGRALLKRDDQKAWSVVLCSGDGLKTADGMVSAGVPKDDAAALANDLALAEATVPQSQRALFSTFDAAGDHAAHPHHDPHSSHPKH